MIDGKDYVSRARLERIAAENYLEVEKIRAGGKSAAAAYLARVYPTVDGRKRRGAAVRLAKACTAWDTSRGCIYIERGMVFGVWIIWRDALKDKRGNTSAFIGPKYTALCPVDWDEKRVTR